VQQEILVLDTLVLKVQRETQDLKVVVVLVVLLVVRGEVEEEVQLKLYLRTLTISALILQRKNVKNIQMIIIIDF
jgi:hypothetical protein